jgi:hypothetical protein
MTEVLMLDDEPSPQQKHWITHEIGDKVVPKLHACIRANQSIMQGQRHQHNEALKFLVNAFCSLSISWRVFCSIYAVLPTF